MLEKMADFFDNRAHGYEDHMKNNIDDFAAFYASVAKLFPKSDKQYNILDLGVGTGLELDLLLPQLPRSEFLLIDLSAKMLKVLKEKFKNDDHRLTLQQASYLEYDFPQEHFDYAVSVQSLHHLLFSEKVEMYSRINSTLKADGRFIEADFIVSPELEKEYLKRYFELTDLSKGRKGEFHLDIPLSLESTHKALNKAGFEITEVSFQSEYAVTYSAKKLEQ